VIEVKREGPDVVSRRGVVVLAYLGLSMASSLLFSSAAIARGATPMDTALGFVWVFALSAIVSASLLPPLLDRRRRRILETGG